MITPKEAFYQCDNCGIKWGKPVIPNTMYHSTECVKCGNIYFRWINYKEFVK